jgi:hypothetical protein
MLYNIIHTKGVLVVMVLSFVLVTTRFKRQLTGNEWNRWLYLCQRLMMVQLSDEPINVFAISQLKLCMLIL